ncbi:uncharacterized protein RCO7_14228 [Rhynchosporium graminicola]|uniref:Uncharacterized protein n=1 Tax=Rhynchosporium graminicola TaxID=2792576 RepID=A0A1E1K120_9HELO|nr:uncharacterized protein RCO7_14228 [Rhynchosporium commune]
MWSEIFKPGKSNCRWRSKRQKHKDSLLPTNTKFRKYILCYLIELRYLHSTRRLHSSFSALHIHFTQPTPVLIYVDSFVRMVCNSTQHVAFGKKCLVNKMLVCHNTTLLTLDPAVRVVPGESDAERVLATAQRFGSFLERPAMSVAPLARLTGTAGPFCNTS